MLSVFSIISEPSVFYWLMTEMMNYGEKNISLISQNIKKYVQVASTMAIQNWSPYFYHLKRYRWASSLANLAECDEICKIRREPGKDVEKASTCHLARARDHRAWHKSGDIEPVIASLHHLLLVAGRRTSTRGRHPGVFITRSRASF